MLRESLLAASCLCWPLSSFTTGAKAHVARVGIPRGVPTLHLQSDTAADEVTPTYPSDQPLAVIGIADGVNKAQGRALTWALRRTLDLSVEWKSIEVELPLDTLLAGAACPKLPDDACLTRIGRKLNLKRFIWGTLTLRRGRVSVHLGVLDGDTTDANTTFEYSANMIDTFDDDLLRLANGGLAHLLGPLHFPVRIRSREQSGRIVVDDVFAGQLDAGVANLSATAGDHRFKLVLSDSTTIARSFQIRIESNNTIRLDFINIPEI